MSLHTVEDRSMRRDGNRSHRYIARSGNQGMRSEVVRELDFTHDHTNMGSSSRGHANFYRAR